MLEDLQDWGLTISMMKEVNSKEELLEFYRIARKNEEEGVIAKDLKMKWTPHSRDGWTKLVPVENLDLEIIDCYYGNGKNHNLINGLTVANKARTIKTNVSSGIKDFERKLLTELYSSNELIGKIAEIKYRELEPEKNGVSSLRFPVFLQLREDKFESD